MDRCDPEERQAAQINIFNTVIHGHVYIIMLPSDHKCQAHTFKTIGGKVYVLIIRQCALIRIYSCVEPISMTLLHHRNRLHTPSSKCMCLLASGVEDGYRIYFNKRRGVYFFTAQLGAAFIGGRRLLEGGVFDIAVFISNKVYTWPSIQSRVQAHV